MRYPCCPQGRRRKCFHQQHAAPGLLAALRRVAVPTAAGGVFLTREEVAAFRDRSLADQAFLYVFLDAT